MKFLIFYLSSFFNKAPSKILIYIQIIIAACSINLTLGMYEYSDQFKKTIPQEILQSGVVILPAFNETFDYENIDEIYQNMFLAFNKLPSVKEIGFYSKTAVSTQSQEEIGFGTQIYSYSPHLFSCNKLDLTRGNISSCGYSNGINHVIASQGSKLELGNEYVFTITLPNNKEGQIKCKVVGISGRSSRLFDLNVGGTDLALNDFYSMPPEERALIGFDLRLSTGEPLDAYKTPGVLALLEDNISIKDVQKTWSAMIGQYAYFTSIQNIVKIQDDVNFEKGKIQFSIGSILVLLCLAGICGSSIIKIIKETREYGIYFLCGQQWPCCVLINTISNLVDIFLPFTIGFAIAKFFTLRPESHSILTINNMLISFFIILTFYVITGLWSVIYLSKTSPIQILRRHQL
jgi:hypothetical protein